MCGIAGQFAYDHAAPPVDRCELRAIRDHMAARGPDGHGEWFSTDGRVALGHRRLSIIDLSDRAAQPMVSVDGQLVISFNGEIYNYRQLKKDLEAKGRVFRTESDTEVLLHLYAEKGAAMLHELRGMYAFALWDARKQALLLARDPFGIKPLYYTPSGGTFRFASQVKALLAGGQIDTAPEPAGHTGFFLWGSVPAPYTLYRGIRALPAGHFMWVGAQGSSEPQPFCLITDILAHAAANPARGTRGDALDAIGAAVRDSIAAHHVADVPVGMFLSAGIDSALITALSSAHGERPDTLTLAFAEYVGTPNDESPLAEQLASQLGTRHATVMVRKADFEEQREQLLAAMDQPSIDGVNTWFVSKAAASQGIKVALSGLGGDELFASYPSFADLPRIRNLARPFARWPGLGTSLRQASLPLLSRFTSPKYAGLLEYGGTLGGAYLLRRSLYMPWELDQVLDGDFSRQGWHELQCRAQLDATTDGIPHDRLAVSALEMSWYMRHQLLVDSDWASMAHSLELRVPFLDVPLLRAAAPWLAAHPGLSKPAVAQALAPQLPRELLRKPKSGFSVPVRDWLMGNQGDIKERGLRRWAGVVYGNACPPIRMPVGSTRLLPSSGYPNQLSTCGSSTFAQSSLSSFALWTPEMAAPGGVQSYMWRLWEMLAAAATSVGALPHGLSLVDTSESLAAWDNPTQTRPLGAGGSRMRFLRYALGRTGRARCVIVGHLHQAPVAWLAWWLGRIDKYVVVLHGIEAWRRLSYMQRIALRRAHTVVATTRYTATICAGSNDLPSNNFRVIPLCTKAVPEPTDPLFELDGELPVLFVGRLAKSEKYKGLETLIRAIAQLRLGSLVPVKLHVVGDGEDRVRLEALASTSGLNSDAITFHGRLHDSALQSAYASAEVFAMPSEKEGFGIVFLEAMRCSVACIGGAHGGTPEVFQDGLEGFLVPYGDVSTLAQRLGELAADPVLRRRLGKAGKERFDRDYTFAAFSARWAAIIRS